MHNEAVIDVRVGNEGYHALEALTTYEKFCNAFKFALVSGLSCSFVGGTLWFLGSLTYHAYTQPCISEPNNNAVDLCAISQKALWVGSVSAAAGCFGLGFFGGLAYGLYEGFKGNRVKAKDGCLPVVACCALTSSFCRN